MKIKHINIRLSPFYVTKKLRISIHCLPKHRKGGRTSLPLLGTPDNLTAMFIYFVK